MRARARACVAGADELIRQVAVSSPERGLLLLRVRDEIRMTTDAYKALYDSSVTFGVRKQVQAEAGIPEMEAAISVSGGRGGGGGGGGCGVGLGGDAGEWTWWLVVGGCSLPVGRAIGARVVIMMAYRSPAPRAPACRACLALQELGDRKKALESSILTLRNRLELIERRQAERRLLEEKRRAEELAYLRHQAKHLDMFLKSIPKL